MPNESPRQKRKAVLKKGGFLIDKKQPSGYDYISRIKMSKKLKINEIPLDSSFFVA